MNVSTNFQPPPWVIELGELLEKVTFRASFGLFLEGFDVTVEVIPQNCHGEICDLIAQVRPLGVPEEMADTAKDAARRTFTEMSQDAEETAYIRQSAGDALAQLERAPIRNKDLERVQFRLMIGGQLRPDAIRERLIEPGLVRVMFPAVPLDSTCSLSAEIVGLEASLERKAARQSVPGWQDLVKWVGEQMAEAWIGWSSGIRVFPWEGAVVIGAPADLDESTEFRGWEESPLGGLYWRVDQDEHNQFILKVEMSVSRSAPESYAIRVIVWQTTPSGEVEQAYTLQLRKDRPEFLGGEAILTGVKPPFRIQFFPTEKD